MWEQILYSFKGVLFCSCLGVLADLCVLAALCVCTVSSGSVTVNADSSVQLLAEEAVPLDQLDIAVSILWISCTNSSVLFCSLNMS